MESVNQLPKGFIEEIEKLLPDEADDFFAAMEQPAEVSVKLNTRKCTDPDILGYGEDLEAVRWCPEGYYLRERPKFTLNPLLHAGVFYVQDASSMIYGEIMGRILPMSLDTGNPPVVADFCAAPGGKTTSIINALPDGSLIVANEFTPARRKALVENLTKWGYPDFIVTGNATSAFRKLGAAFDIIAVDAPCSGEGMMRKEETAVSQWCRGLVAQCAALQREILADACAALKPGGFLIYSTCTFNRQEDEEQIEWLATEHDMVPFYPGFPEEWNIKHGIGTDMPCFRFMPHKTRGEGLFVAVMRKEEDKEERVTPLRNIRKLISKELNVIADGIPRTRVKGRDEVPCSEAVLATDCNLSEFYRYDADEQTALSYLRHEALRLPPDVPKGFVAVCYQGHPLGLVKNLGSRANNLYPAEWRIRNL